jgi:hypothetical protein
MNRQQIEAEIALELPNAFEKYDDSTKEYIIKYLKHLNPIEKQAYTIGKSYLGSSFNILKSNGYLDWKKNN